MNTVWRNILSQQVMRQRRRGLQVAGRGCGCAAVCMRMLCRVLGWSFLLWAAGARAQQFPSPAYTQHHRYWQAAHAPHQYDNDDAFYYGKSKYSLCNLSANPSLFIKQNSSKYFFSLSTAKLLSICEAFIGLLNIAVSNGAGRVVGAAVELGTCSRHRSGFPSPRLLCLSTYNTLSNITASITYPSNLATLLVLIKFNCNYKQRFGNSETTNAG